MNKKNRKLGNGMQRLEEKALMAGDVAINLIGGDLHINEADLNDSQEVRVYQRFESNGMSRLRVQGMNGSRVSFNGNVQNSHDVWVSDGIHANLGGGNDRITFESWYGGIDVDEVRINTGSGSDRVNIRGLNATGRCNHQHGGWERRH